MCCRFRTKSGREWRPGEEVPLELAEGGAATGVWAGFATREKLEWWLRGPGNVLAQMREEVVEVAERADDTGEIQWGAAAEGTRLVFVLEGSGKRLARMVTTRARRDQEAYFRHGRFPLLGVVEQGRLREVEGPPAPEPKPKAQGELF